MTKTYKDISYYPVIIKREDGGILYEQETIYSTDSGAFDAPGGFEKQYAVTETHVTPLKAIPIERP